MNHRFAYLLIAGLTLPAAPPALMSASPLPQTAKNVQTLADSVTLADTVPKPDCAQIATYTLAEVDGRIICSLSFEPSPCAVASSVDGLDTIDARETPAGSLESED